MIIIAVNQSVRHDGMPSKNGLGNQDFMGGGSGGPEGLCIKGVQIPTGRSNLWGNTQQSIG